MLIAAQIKKTLNLLGNRRLLRTSTGSLSAEQILQGSTSWHRFLDQLEIAPGERIALILPNTENLVLVHTGNLLSGRVTVPLNPRQTQEEFIRIFADAEPSLVVVSASANPTVRAALAELGHSPHILDESLIPSAIHGGSRSPEPKAPGLKAHHPAMIVYTSGTTGKPKGAILTQGNLAQSAASLIQAWEFTPQDRLLLTLPLFHVHGLSVGIHGMLTAGYEVELHPRFDAPATLGLLASKEKAFTLFFGVPTYFHRFLMEEDHRDLSHLRLCLCGSAPLAAGMHQEILEHFGITLIERYGMSETLMNISNPIHGPIHPGFVGQPLPGVKIKIADMKGNEVAPGFEGEILIRGPHVTPGYWRNEKATTAAFTQDGWFRSGDLGRFDRDRNSYQITGRKKELIISGGYNIHPREVEESLADFCGIREVAIGGHPDQDMGEIVTAFIVPQDKSQITLEKLQDHCRHQISAYKIPRKIVFVQTLPRNALGKIQRSLLL